MSEWTYSLGLLGAGNMAEAIVRSAIDRGVLSAAQIVASDPSEVRRAVFDALGVKTVSDNAQVIGTSAQVLIAVKPQVMKQAAADLAKGLTDSQVVISIMAGVTSAKLSKEIGRPTRVVRVMPNTPLLVGEGMAGVALGVDAKAGDDALAMKLFAAGGKAIRVEEKLIDSVTAVSGSGPAYVFYLAQLMEESARELGLGDHARTLVAQTITGAAKLLAQSPDSAEELRRKVTSPGGTTEAAIKHMQANGMDKTIIEAIHAAHKRSIELGA
ncbi:MAG: pyrroline-5-carboxylate reductase [Phycisphaera sp.]|nr:pyrroline-5-carboxylate reductase [Phycisphaera sp.]